ncbi:short tail fiber protein [Synechococcus phage ACG-2014h]|uniref:Tail fiber-like protein n=1 Tax=Synechococcus phage ACG-2014h TaxID=1340810 RepID=V5USY2_9CAUD|nr:short tail fiber protein [Synechococcus phage ACG-2014h]AHB80440.1 tail fiber-like protein [Synechococcus phage ACG-2014h]
MPLTRLDNLITSKTGKYLYVSPDDFNASDELNNRGNSPVRPFKSIQRAFLEVARFSYLPGVDNDRFDQFTIMLMPGEHFIDNRPGLTDVSGISQFGFDTASNEWTDNSILDLSNPDNVLYKFNNTEGGAIIPRGTSLVGYDLRRTMVKPLYVPDPADSREKRSAIFNVTGGCYFWQFTIKDGETSSLSPLYDSNDGIGKVYYAKDDFTKLTVPNYSHHKLTVFEYADKEELSLLYRKIAEAFQQFSSGIADIGPSGIPEFGVRVQENRIVGPLSDSRSIEKINLNDNTSQGFGSLPGSTTQVDIFTRIDHGYFQGQFVAVTNTNIDDILEGTFQITAIDPNDPRKFSYLVPQSANSIGTGITSGKELTETSTPPLSSNAQTLAEVDSVESASPYVFNVSIRSTWGICGIWANGLKATGFKSMVIAQYTGVSLQKDDRAFIRYDEFTNTWNQANLTDAFDSIPYHTKGDSYWKDEWRNFHVRASEDAFIQNVSIFAVGFADHFLMESGGDMSITNSNSNFGNTSLHAIGHKGFSFNSDKGGYIDAIIPPKIIETTDEKFNYYPFNVPASITGVEGVQQLPISGVRTLNHSRVYLDSQDDAVDPGKRPAASIEGFRLGARQNEKIYTTVSDTVSQTDDGIYWGELAVSGYKKYIAKPSILSPSAAPSGAPADFHLRQDAANLITSNKTFIQEEVFGYIIDKYPNLQTISYVNPGLDPAANRYQDASNLIIANRSDIVDDAYDRMYETYGPAGENNAAFLAGNDETKCKRDIGLIVDAIAEDLRDGGNRNIIEVTKKYFNPDGTPLANGLVGEEEFAIYAFRRARDLCKQAIANQLLITDNTITVDPANDVSKQLTPTNATYNAGTGEFTFTVAGHGYGTDDSIEIEANSFTFTCDQDNNQTLHTYPASGNYADNATIQIESVTTDTITVNVGDAGSASGSVHSFVSVAANAVTVYPGENPNSVASRNKDAHNLIIANKNDMITEAINAITTAFPTFNFPGGSDAKCRRDLGIIVDGIAQDLWFGGNEYTIGNTIEYFDGNSLLSNGVAGEVDKTIVGLQKLEAQMALAVNNQLANTDNTITRDSSGDPVIVDNSHCDAEKLIRKNKKFIAEEAYQRMLVTYPSYTPSAGNTKQDCLDDVYNVLDEILYNVKFGGNHKTYDAANIYVTNVFNGQTVSTFIDAERDEAARVFTEAGNIATDVMRNIIVTPTNWTPSGSNEQVRDLTIIADSNNPTCQGVASTLNTLFGIVTQAIGTDSGVGDLNGITRTVPAQPTAYTAGNCSDVLGNINTLVSIFSDNLYAGNLNDLPAINNGNWDCANVRSSIDTLFDIINDSIGAGSLTGLPVVNNGDFLINAQASKCYRDVGYIVDAVSNDLKFGGNINSVQAGEAYYVGTSLTYIDNEKNETIDAWNYVKTLSISAMRNHTTQANGCEITSGSAIVTVPTTEGLAIGMLAQEYLPAAFDSNAQLLSGQTPVASNIPASGVFIKRIVSANQIELGISGARLDNGETQTAAGSNSNATLYFTLSTGGWADTLPSTDPSVLSSNAGYPECATVASAIDVLVDNIIFIINNGLNSVTRQEPPLESSDFAKRSTLWTIDITGAGSGDPHEFETGTPVRLVPRPRFDTVTGKYVDVDKRLVRLPNGFETNRKYYVIAPGRTTQPASYTGDTNFDGSAGSQNKLMLAESKENAASGIYIFSSESDAIDPDVEVDIYQFVLDEKYDLHQYKVNLYPNENGAIKTNVANIFDIPESNVASQRVFFRPSAGNQLPLLSSTYNSDNAAANGGDSTIGVADSAGRLNPEFAFYVRYINPTNNPFPNKLIGIYASSANAEADVNRINFVGGQQDVQFIAYANKKASPLAFDPRGTAYSNSATGRWYIKVKDTSSTGNAAIYQDSILWRFQQGDYLTSPPPKTDDSYYFRQVDSRDAKDRVYRVRYTIPSYETSARDPINGFVLKTRTDGLRKLRPQKILLKPAPGTTKTDAFFENTANAGERIGWTNAQIIAALNDDANAYDPYKTPRTVTTQVGKVSFTIQSAKLVDINGDDYLEMVVFDPQPDQTVPSLSNETFRTVRIGAPQGGLFTTNSSSRTAASAVTWDGFSSGSAWVQAYFEVNNEHYLILKGAGIDGNLIWNQYTGTTIRQAGIFAEVLGDPDEGKSLPLKRLIEKNIPENFYKQNRAPVYQMTPGDIIQEDGSTNQYYIDSVEDLGEIDDTFYIFDIDELQRRIAGQQDGVYYLTLLRGNISPLPLGAGNGGNFRNFKFSQPVSFLYPLNYKNDPFWFQYNGTSAQEIALSGQLIDPPSTFSAADNYVHGLVRTNDSKSSVTREMIADLTQTPAFITNSYSGVNAVKAQEGNASAGAEDRIIPLSGDNRTASQQKFFVELRRPSIARAGNHTFEYLGFGPGNYSTGLPARQEIVLTDTQDFYAQSKKQDGGIVFYTGINSNGELYIGNRKINAITGEEEFLERATLLDSEDEDDDIGSLVTTFDVPVTFNQNITVNGGDGDKVSAFNAPVLINVSNDDLTLQEGPLIIRSRVQNQNPPPDGSSNDPLLDRSLFNPRSSGDIFIGKNYVKAAVFEFNSRRNGQEYKFQTHTVGSDPSNITPNQSGQYGTPGGNAINFTAQRAFYGTGVNGQLPRGGDVLLKGESVQRSGSLGWIFANYFTNIPADSINSINLGGLYAKINWANVNGVQQTNQLLNITETSSIRISNFFPTPLLEGSFTIVSPTGDPFNPTNSYLHIQLSETIASIVYNDSSNTQTTDSNPAWSVLTNSAVLSNNNASVAPTMDFARSTWKEVGVLGGEALRTDTESVGNYKLGVNTVARSNHAAYQTAFVDADTDARANLDVVGTAFISGKTIPNYLDHATFASRTETAQDNAFLVGGDSGTPDNEATLRVSTTNGGRLGINVTNGQLNGNSNNGWYNEALAVDGNGFISGNLRVETDLAVNGGDFTTTQTTFNLLEATVTTLNFANDATTVNAFNDATGTQTINVGGSTDNQNLNIGTAADTSRLNIHTTSEDSEINIGTVPNTTNTFRSLITIGGARLNAAESRLTVKNFQTILESSILEINNGLTSIVGNEDVLVELQSNARNINLFTRNGAGAEINAFTRAVALSFGAIAGQTTINNALNVKGDTLLEGDVTQQGGNNSGAVTVTRGVLGTGAIVHNIGDLNSLNVDHYGYIERYCDSLRFTTTAVSNNTLVVDNVVGPANYLVEGNIVVFTDTTGLSGVATNTLYYAFNVTGQTFQIVSTAVSTTPVTITGTPTDARVILDSAKVDTGNPGTPISAGSTVLPLNNVNNLTVGDLLLIDDEIVRVQNPPSEANRTVVVERGISCTTATSHLDNAAVAKLIFTQDATFIREGDAGPSDVTLSAAAGTIQLGEFGGQFNPLDFLRLSAGATCPSGEFVRIVAIIDASPERLIVNNGVTGNNRLNIDSVSGEFISTLVDNQIAGTADFQVQLTTADNRFVIERDTTGTERLVINRDGEVKIIGDGTATASASLLTATGAATFTGDLRVTNTNAQDTSLDNGRLRLVQSSGDLDVAGGIDFDGPFRLYANSTGINFVDPPEFMIAGDGEVFIYNDINIIGGGININNINNWVTPTGGRKWVIVDTPSNSDSNAVDLVVNTNYLVKPAGTDTVLVLRLPAAATGDMIRFVDIAGNLTYNCQLVIRAQTGVRIQGDNSGTTLGNLSTAYNGGELIVNTRNAGFGLIYVGTTDGDGTSIGSADQGWRLVEV